MRFMFQHPLNVIALHFLDFLELNILDYFRLRVQKPLFLLEHGFPQFHVFLEDFLISLNFVKIVFQSIFLIRVHINTFQQIFFHFAECCFELVLFKINDHFSQPPVSFFHCGFGLERIFSFFDPFSDFLNPRLSLQFCQQLIQVRSLDLLLFDSFPIVLRNREFIAESLLELFDLRNHKILSFFLFQKNFVLIDEILLHFVIPIEIFSILENFHVSLPILDTDFFPFSAKVYFAFHLVYQHVSLILLHYLLVLVFFVLFFENILSMLDFDLREFFQLFLEIIFLLRKNHVVQSREKYFVLDFFVFRF